MGRWKHESGKRESGQVGTKKQGWTTQESTVTADPAHITDAVADIQEHVNDDSPHANRLRQFISYVRRQWISKRSVGPERLCVQDNQNRTNNVLESYHAALRRRIKVSSPNLYSFLGHLQQITTDQMNDVHRCMARIGNTKKYIIVHDQWSLTRAELSTPAISVTIRQSSHGFSELFYAQFRKKYCLVPRRRLSCSRLSAF